MEDFIGWVYMMIVIIMIRCIFFQVNVVLWMGTTIGPVPLHYVLFYIISHEWIDIEEKKKIVSFVMSPNPQMTNFEQEWWS